MPFYINDKATAQINDPTVSIHDDHNPNVVSKTITTFANNMQYIENCDGNGTIEKVCIFPNGDKYIGELRVYEHKDYPAFVNSAGELLFTDEQENVLSNLVIDPDVYTGKAHFCIKYGRGVMRYVNGDIYDGMWKDLMHGSGEMQFTNGDVYIGNWRKDLFHGEGTLKLASGAYYRGTWCKGVKCGFGEQQYASGTFYRGNWLDGVAHGTGESIRYNGSRYIGEFINGKAHGIGTLIFANGASYVGKWYEGHYNGHGILKSASGEEVIDGCWDMNVLISKYVPVSQADVSQADVSQE